MRNILFVLALVMTLAFPALGAVAPSAPGATASSGVTAPPDFLDLAFHGGLSAEKLPVQQSVDYGDTGTNWAAVIGGFVLCGTLGFLLVRETDEDQAADYLRAGSSEERADAVDSQNAAIPLMVGLGVGGACGWAGSMLFK